MIFTKDISFIPEQFNFLDSFMKKLNNGDYMPSEPLSISNQFLLKICRFLLSYTH